MSWCSFCFSFSASFKDGRRKMKERKERSNVTIGDWGGTNFYGATKNPPGEGGLLWRSVSPVFIWIGNNLLPASCGSISCHSCQRERIDCRDHLALVSCSRLGRDDCPVESVADSTVQDSWACSGFPDFLGFPDLADSSYFSYICRQGTSFAFAMPTAK